MTYREWQWGALAVSYECRPNDVIAIHVTVHRFTVSFEIVARATWARWKAQGLLK